VTLSAAVGLLASIEAYAQSGAAGCAWRHHPEFFKAATVAEVERCLKAGTDPNAGAELGWTLLHSAAIHSPNPAVIAALVEAGADPNAKDEGGRTPLYFAAARDFAVFNALIEAGANPDVRAEGGLTLLHFAAHNENPMIIAALVDSGADPNAKWLRGDVTPLHVAAEENQNPAVIAALVEAGADPNVRAAGGRTPLHVAAAKNPNPKVITALLDAGAVADARDAAGKLPLDYAKRNRAIRGSEAYRRLTRAFEVPYPLPGPPRDPSRAQAKGITLYFQTWPLDAEETAPLVRKLRNAGLKAVRAHPLFKSWVFAWDELHEMRFAETMCFELALDDQVSSLFASCAPDAVPGPPRPVAD